MNTFICLYFIVCPPNEPEVITDDDEQDLPVIPIEVVTSVGVIIPARGDIVITSPDGTDFRLMDVIFTISVTMTVTLTVNGEGSDFPVVVTVRVSIDIAIYNKVLKTFTDNFLLFKTFFFTK